MNRRLAIAGAVLGASLAAWSPVRGQQAVTVSPASMGKWTISTTNTGAASFVKGPASPPLGAGSLMLSPGGGEGPGQGGKIWFGSTQFDGIRLGQLTTLRYSAYVEKVKGIAVAPYVNIHLDTNDNGQWDGRSGGDDIVVYDPLVQPWPAGQRVPLETWRSAPAPAPAPGNGPAPGDNPSPPAVEADPGGAAYADAYDAGPDVGQWWVVGKDAVASQGAPKTLPQIIAVLGDHRIVANASERTAGLTFVAGTSSGSPFTDFVGFIDAIVVGVDGRETTFDLEWSEAPPPPPPPVAQAPSPASALPTPTPDGAGSGGRLTLLLVLAGVVAVIAIAVAISLRKAGKG